MCRRTEHAVSGGGHERRERRCPHSQVLGARRVRGSCVCQLVMNDLPAAVARIRAELLSLLV
ncbi:MAG: hypothetical protein ACLQVI_27705 [Polyangiaceae bacterium]